MLGFPVREFLKDPIQFRMTALDHSAAKREALNQWIRTSREFDGVIDFDAALRDPKNPKSMLPAFDSGDHLNPNDDGYKAMADAVDLKVLD